MSLFNAGASLLSLSRDRGSGRGVQTGMAATVAAGLVLALVASPRIEQFFLRKFYYAEHVQTLASVFEPMPEFPKVERRRSAYQSIDLVRRVEDSGAWLYTLLSTKRHHEPDYPSDLGLYLNRDFQLYSAMDELYHEWFVHAPIQARGRVPRRVLVLGGGDALALRELLGYPEIERLVHVELDPVMRRLAGEHADLAGMNGGAMQNPRIESVEGDAFSWLRRQEDRFDAVYIDMPYPRDYNVAKVYSREFYSLVRARLATDGFVIFDSPDGDCRYSADDGGLWPLYYSTLRAAGFDTIVGVANVINTDAPPVSTRVQAVAEQLAAASNARGSDHDTEAFGAHIRRLIREHVSRYQEFVLAFPDETDLRTDWTPVEAPTYAFGPSHLESSLIRDCDESYHPDLVNSIFRPTLPPLNLLKVPTA